MGKRASTDTIEEIFTKRFAEGLKLDEIAKQVNKTREFVRKTCKIYDLVKNEEWEKLTGYILTDHGYTSRTVNFCCSKLYKKLPQEVEDAFTTRSERMAKKPAEPPKEEKPKEEAPKAAPISQAEVTNKVNESLFFTRILQEMMRMNENLIQLMDVVIPKYVGDMKDCMNTNTDLLTARLAECGKRLEKIEYQTRKRGL